MWQVPIYDPTHLRPVSPEVLKSLGCFLRLRDADISKTQFDERLSPIFKTNKTLAQFVQDNGLIVSDIPALPRFGSVVQGDKTAGVNFYNSPFTNLLSGAEFPALGSQPDVTNGYANKNHSWEEVLKYPQAFVDALPDINTKTTVQSDTSQNGFLNPFSRKSTSDGNKHADFYYFDVKKGDEFQITLSSSDFNPVLDVYDDAKNQLLWSDGSRASRGNSQITQTAPFDGRLRIECSTYEQNYIGAYVFKLVSSEIPNDTNTGGGNPNATTSIAVGQAVSGTLASTDANSPLNSGAYADNYLIYLTKNQTINVGFRSPAVPGDPVIGGVLYMLDANSKSLVGYGLGSNGTFNFTAPEAGTYRIHVTSNGKQVGSYVLNVIPSN